MNQYTEKWTREKFIEYRKLKRKGYSDQMLIEHFGEDIYESGLYNKKSSIMSWLQFITEIKITPQYTEYNHYEKKSDIYENEFDIILTFEESEVKYVILLFFYTIGDTDTYSIILTTEEQWELYKMKLEELRHKNYITEEERNQLVNIIEKETNLNKIYPLMKKVSYILFDFVKNKLGNVIFSIGQTKNPIKINLYRNIIKNSFTSVIEMGFKIDSEGNKYYIYLIESN